MPRRPVWILALVLLLGAAPAAARLRVRSVAVDAKGLARVHGTRPQIFDEIGGKADLGLDLPGGRGVLTSDLTLPEEAGDINGEAYVGMNPETLSAVGDFTYRPLKRRQMRLDVDSHSVEDATHATGVSRLAVNYPLSLEHVGKHVAAYLARTSYLVSGHGRWSHYTEAEGRFKVRIADPELRRQPTDIRTLAVQIVDHDTITDFTLHYDVARGSQTARLLQSGQALELIFQQVFAGMGIRCRDFRVDNVRTRGKSTLADVFVSIYSLRQTLLELMDRPVRRLRFKGIHPADVAVALGTMIQVQFPQLDLLIHRRADHFDVDVNVRARKVDQAIVGYLRLMEVLGPAAMQAGTRNLGFSALTRSINAVKTRRFRNVVVAAANSQDGGTFEYSLRSAFPHGRVQFSQSYQYDNVLTAYAFASQMMHVPAVTAAYSRLQVHTTAAGLRGHFLYEARGPWLQSTYALCQEAVQGDATLQPLFPVEKDPTVQEGRLHFVLKKSRVTGAGWVVSTTLAPYAQSLLLAAAKADVVPVAMRLRYDADQEPGVISSDEYLQGASRARMIQAVPGLFGKGFKLETVGAIAPPPLAHPRVEISSRLAGEMNLDRKFLGIRSSRAALAEGQAPGLPAALRRYVILYAVGMAFLVGAGGLMLILFARSRRPYVPPPVLLEPPAFAPAAEPVPVPPSPAESRAAFQREMVQRIQQALPGCSVGDKDVLELYLTHDGMTRTVDIESLFYLCSKPAIDREQAIQSFMTGLPGT